MMKERLELWLAIALATVITIIFCIYSGFPLWTTIGMWMWLVAKILGELEGL